MLRRVHLSLLVIGLLAPLLLACGKKNSPSPPEGEKYEFPKQYPRK